MADQAIYSPMRAFDANGLPVPGALATFYARGTLTKIDVWLDAAGTTISTNPVEADARGVWPVRYVNEPATCVITTPTGETLDEIDPVPVTLAGVSEADRIGFSPTTNIPHATVQAAIEAVDTNSRARDDAVDDRLGDLGDLAELDKIAIAQIDAATLVTRAQAVAGVAATDTRLATWSALMWMAGDGQTWQDVLTSRALDVAYQNTTGRRIDVSVVSSPTGSGNRYYNLEISTDNTTWLPIARGRSDNADQSFVTGSIPPMIYYRVTSPGVGGGISSWCELR